MGKKQQDAIKMKQALITFIIYCIPETFPIINQMIQDVHAKDYLKVFKERKGKSKPPLLYKAMENPRLMFPKYLYIIHYMIRRKLQFTSEYEAEGFGISVVEMRRRIAVDTSVMSLMLEKLQEPQYNILRVTKNYSTYQKKARKYKLTEELEELVNPESKYVLNRRDHGKMVEKLIKYGKEGKEYNEELNAIQYGDKDENDSSIPTEAPSSIKNQGQRTEEIDLELATRYFDGLRKEKIHPSINHPGDVDRAIRKRMKENKALPDDKKQQLLAFLPEYIKAVPVPESVVREIETLLEPIYQDLHRIYKHKGNLISMMCGRIVEELNHEVDYKEMKSKVAAFVESKFKK